MVSLAALLLTQANPAKGIKWVPKIESRAQFDKLARVGYLPYELPHLRFTIDRRDNKIYYYDSKVDRHHRELANATYLSLESADRFLRNNYLSPDRRFILGWVGYHSPVKKWAFEFWEGDTITGTQIAYVASLLKKTFFVPVVFKPNSLRQEEESASLKDVPRVLPSEIHRNQTYEAVNLGRSVGRLRILPSLEGVELMPDDIVVLSETPISMPPVSGIVFNAPTTPLSHLSLMARQWRIPSAYVRGSATTLKKLEGQIVAYEARAGGFSMHRATPDEIRKHNAVMAARQKSMTPSSDLTVRKLAALTDQSAASSIAYGAKSANLGAVARAGLKGVVVPPGFTLPFSYYSDFLKANGIDQTLKTLLADPKFHADPTYRRERLKQLRAQFQAGKFSSDLRKSILARVAKEFGAKGLFVRSSTNAEDLKNFSGAGLYTTVPNVVGADPLIEAIKTVWGSVWNDDAVAARERAGIPHLKVSMAVLIQEGIKAESAGVMTTANPFDPTDKGAIYISAKRGLGIKVVEGKRVPEQLIFRPEPSSVQVLTRSEEDSLLTFDANGGVKEVPIDAGRAVLNDEMVRRLASVGARIQKLFHGAPQDIEWIVIGRQIYIVQARPYMTEP
jgi:hypothetical protein